MKNILKVRLLLVQPTALGPNLLCILAIVFLSATVTKATVNKTGTVTSKTSVIEIIVGVYNMFKIKGEKLYTSYKNINIYNYNCCFILSINL